MEVHESYHGREQAFVKHHLLEAYLLRLFMIIGQHQKTIRYVPQLARPLIGLNVRLTKWEYRLRGSPHPALPPGKDLLNE